MDDPFPTDMLPCIADFFMSEETRQPGLDSYADVFNSPLFFPLQRVRELEKMICIARSAKPRIVMEIGADKGGGLYHWCKCLPSVERVIACEIRGTPYCDLFERYFPEIDFLWLPQGSMDWRSVEAVRKWLGKDTIDILFIDGDKGTFLTDFNHYVGEMKPGGVVFMHDVQDSPPKLDFETVALQWRTERIIDTSEVQDANERAKLNGGRPVTAHDGWLMHWNGRSAGVGVIYL
jgi:predicted O-methyltransferase YrrM